MPRGAVTQELIDFHVAVARGGAALTTVAYCAVSMGGRVNRHTLVFHGRPRRRPDPAHRRGPRRRRRGVGPARPRRAGGAGPVEEAPEHGAVEPVQRPGDGPGEGGLAGTARRGGRRLRACDEGRCGRRLRCGRDPPRSQLPAELVHEPEPEPATRRARRKHREPGSIPAPGRRGGPQGRRRSCRRAGQVQHGRRRRRRSLARREPADRRGCSKPTATSTRSSSPAAARCSTGCTSSAATSR